MNWMFSFVSQVPPGQECDGKICPAGGAFVGQVGSGVPSPTRIEIGPRVLLSPLSLRMVTRALYVPSDA